MSKMTTYKTTDMHAGGAIFRIIEVGYPSITGTSLFDKIKTMENDMDDIRKLLMFEPRGHFDMNGILLVPPNVSSADVAAIVMQNEGYSEMCGDAVMCLGRYLVDKGFIKNLSIPEIKINIQMPCGLVESCVQYDGKKSGNVRFFSVPAFLLVKDFSVKIPGFGTIVVDIAYGGAYYALVSVSQYNLERAASIQKIREAAGATTETLRNTLTLKHPENGNRAYLFGTIVTDGNDVYSNDVTWNACVFAEAEVDRSPCGSGVTARIAQQYARGLIQLNQKRTFEGPSGATYTGVPVKEVSCGECKAVIVEVSGHSYYTGTSTFTLEEDDKIGRGFLLK